ncbi:hypothetical protein BKA62DRAFT_611499 [Auriculariales sp. MPI-PUGE-AT-0066]|nr:hypothetical protein BKA62DRAFT_611499 [Auriculariales sp. MPI-PUGE-AT-0066]
MSPQGPHHSSSGHAQFGDHGHIIWREDTEEDLFLSRPRKFRDLIRPPTVRQWLVEGKIHREQFERQQSRFELFFDLVFVAFAHHLSDAAAESATGINFLRFVLTFYPAWSLWAEFRTFMNQSGTDDTVTRLTVLFLMAVLVGYSANASAINFDFGHTSNEAAAEATPAATEAIGEAAHELIRRATSSEEAPAVDGRQALVAATAFFMAGRGIRLPMIAVYAWNLPHFAHAFLAQGALHLMVLLLLMPCLWVTSATTVIVLVVVAIFVDVFGRFLPAVLIFTSKWLQRHAHRPQPDPEASQSEEPVEKKSFFHSKRHVPAINIEHHIERTVSFVIIVLGEIVISVVYHVTSTSLGLSMVYFRAVLGLVIAFNIAAIYFDVSGTGTSVHAVRRHWFSAVAWDQLHWPFSCALILCGAAISRIVTTEESSDVSNGIRWYFCGGLGASMFALAAMGAAHRNLEPPGLTRFSRAVMLGARVVVGIALILLPIAKAENLSSTELLGVATALTGLVVMVEVYGKLHSPAALLHASSESVASSSTLEDYDGVATPANEEEKAAAIALDDDCICRTWCEWVEMEKARKTQRRRAAKEQKAERRLHGDKKHERHQRRWQLLQHQRKTEDPLACAITGY